MYQVAKLGFEITQINFLVKRAKGQNWVSKSLKSVFSENVPIGKIEF